MTIRKINYTVIAPEVEQEIKDKYTKAETDSKLAGKVNNSQVLTDVPINAKFTDTKYSEITTAEIDAGTASTLRTITARRIKYILDKVQGWINSLTKSDVGLSNVDNTSDLNKPISSATQTALNSKVDNSRVLTDVPINAKFTDTIYTHPANHPASFIIESGTRRFVSDTEKANWNAKGNSNLALGETATTAYHGDRGKVAYDHSQLAHAPVDAGLIIP